MKEFRTMREVDAAFFPNVHFVGQACVVSGSGPFSNRRGRIVKVRCAGAKESSIAVKLKDLREPVWFPPNRILREKIS